MNAGEVEILRQAARTCDLIARLEQEIDSAPPMVAGSMGQLRPHPLIKVVEDHRELLRRLIRDMRLPEEALRPKQVPRTARGGAVVQFPQTNRDA
jgi:hypothetical protein